MPTQNYLPANVTRRGFLATSAGTAVLLPRAVSANILQAENGPHQATGTRVGEVTENSAIVWTRLTKQPERNKDGVEFAEKVDRHNTQPVTVPVEKFEGACPGTPGR